MALGFIGQTSSGGDAFNVFVLTALPTLYILGLFTFVRLVQGVAEDFQYARAINRIRHYYVDLAGDRAHLFMLSAHDDAIGVLRNMNIRRQSAWQAYFTTPTLVAVISGVVGGAAVAFFTALAFHAEAGIAAIAGGAVAVASLTAHRRFEREYLRASLESLETLFPTPPK